MKTNPPEKRLSRLQGRGYALMLTRLVKSDATTDEVCAAIGRPRTNMLRTIIRQFQQLRLIHITDWVRQSHKGVLVPLWRFGDGVNAPYPVPGCRNRLGVGAPVRVGIEMRAFANFIGTLADGDASIADLVESTGWGRPTTSGLVGVCRAAKLNQLPERGTVRLLHVSDWIRRDGSGGAPTPLYSLGNKRDVLRPTPRTAAEQCAMYTRRLKAQKMLHLLAGTMNAGSAA